MVLGQHGPIEGDAPQMKAYPLGFEENDRLRSRFIRDLTLEQLSRAEALGPSKSDGRGTVPRTLVRYWHEPDNVPDDVRACLDSWGPLRTAGVEFRMFCDVSAMAYISEMYGSQERDAFKRCRHPAMRSDYLRLCFVLAEGGLYVDADDVLSGAGWEDIFRSRALNVQPLCYDISTGKMVPSHDVWRRDLPTEGRVFYVNNNPIAAPAAHPVLRRALDRATKKLLGDEPFPEIQSTTGPGNLTAALAAHARDLLINGSFFDFQILYAWDTVAETCWDLSYRGDARNWRNMDAPGATMPQQDG